MSTIYDLPEVRERAVRWSVDEYEVLANEGRLPRNVELIRGVVIEKMPKSPLHRQLAKDLYDLVASALPPGFIVYFEAPLRLADSEPEPDIMVVRGTRKEFSQRHPRTAALVVEVAVSSAGLDRAYAPMYAEGGVEEYWIILGKESAVEVYSAPLGGTYTQRRLIAASEMLACSSVSGLSVPLGAVFSPAED